MSRDAATAAVDVGLTQDALLDGRVLLRQPARGYRAAIDPVFLAAAVPARAGERVLDLGCGVGAAALCLLTRLPAVEVTGLELQGEMARLAVDNAKSNGLSARFRVLQGDILAPPATLEPGTFDRVMLNPPYLTAAAARPAECPAQATATREAEAGLADWLRAAIHLLRPKGSLTVIHRADRLDAILAALQGHAGEVKVFPLWPGAERPAKRVVVAARKAVATPVTLMAGLVLHGAGGGFTPAAEAVLRGAEGLGL